MTSNKNVGAVFEQIICNQGEHLDPNSNSCILNSYLATYPQNDLEACDGTREVSALTCKENWGSQKSVSLALCEKQNQKSPAGSKNESLINGTLVKNCVEGSSTGSISVLCNSGYHEETGACILKLLCGNISR
jgi:hypothetical protein